MKQKLLLASSALALVMAAGTASAGWNGWGKDPAPKSPKNSISTTVTENHDFSNDVNTDWDWHHDVKSNLDIDAYVDFDIENLHDLTEISNVQKQVGDVTATTDIDTYVGGNGGYGGHNKGFGGSSKDVDLPIVLGSATAIGNMVSISSSEPSLLLNSDQIVMDIDGGKVDIDATLDSKVIGAAVNLDATAIGNMLSVDMSNPQVLVASVMQTNYGDVSASADSYQKLSGDYDFDDFDGLNPENISGGVQVEAPDMKGVIASVNATAIGNMASFNLGQYASIPTGAGTNYGSSGPSHGPGR